MFESLTNALVFLNQILDAGNTITAFSLLLYSLTFNLRDRVARAFAVLLACVTAVSFMDVLVGSTASPAEKELWLRLQWAGIAFVPAVYLQFSDALLAATGRPSRGRRKFAVRISYLAGIVFLALAAAGNWVGGRVRFLMVSGVSPALGAFPFLMLGGSVFARAPFLLWAVVGLSNLAVAFSLLLMASGGAH